MYTGKSPFRGKNGDQETFDNIINNNMREIPNTVPEEARDLIKKLLVLNPGERLGCGRPFEP